MKAADEGAAHTSDKQVEGRLATQISCHKKITIQRITLIFSWSLGPVHTILYT